MNPHRPFVLLNLAMTADGKIATANRAVSSFGSRRDREHLYELRATADAVMSGARTIELSDAKLGSGGARFEAMRRRRGLARFGLRIIVSGSGSIDPQASIFQHRFSPIIILTTRRAPAARLRALEPFVDEVFVAGEKTVDFAKAFCHLRRRWNVRRLLSEGGGELNDALFRAGLVDELHLTICPKIFGGRTAPTMADGVGAKSLAHARFMKLQRCQKVGDELFLKFGRSS